VDKYELLKITWKRPRKWKAGLAIRMRLQSWFCLVIARKESAVKRILRAIMIVLGALMIIAAILWWTVGLNVLLKVPGDIDTTPVYEGEMTWYVNPTTKQPLPEGEEIVQPFEVKRNIVSLDDEYDSSTAVLKETDTLIVDGVEQEPRIFVYTLDRKDMKNVADERAYAWEESINVDRSGAYFPVFPFDLSKEGDYPLWKNEVNAAIPVIYIDEAEKGGLKVYNFDVGFEQEQVWEPYFKVLGLPTELSFEEFSAKLSAMGVDVDALMALAAQALTPEDLQALAQASAQPIPLSYYWEWHAEASVEPATGALVNLSMNEDLLTMEPDYASLTGLFSILMKYAQDPVLGPALQTLVSLQAQLGEAEPQRILKNSYAQTSESVSEAIQKTKDSRSKLSLVKLWIPLILIIVGVLLLLVSALWRMMSRPV